MVQYPDINHADYLDTVDKLTASLTARVDYREYEGLAAQLLTKASTSLPRRSGSRRRLLCGKLRCERVYLRLVALNGNLLKLRRRVFA